MDNQECKKKKRPLALTYLFGSFFGAFMVAAAFGYFNLKFSQYQFIDFDKITLYSNRSVFKPTEKYYTVILFSSNATPLQKISDINSTYPKLIIDINQRPFDNDEDSTFVLGSINTILAIIQRFNIYNLPSAFLIKKEHKMRYKQNSGIEVLE